MRKLLFAVSVLIVYGSFYPFNFDLGSYNSSMLRDLFHFDLGRARGGDFISNVFLFVPFGFVAMQAAKDHSPWKSWLVILGVAFVFAHAIQAVQLIIPGRDPSGRDTVWNVLGCAFGCLLGMMRTPRFLGSPGMLSGPLPIPTLLAVLLILWNLRPFVPSLDLQLLIDNLKHLLSLPVPSPVWTLQSVVTWLIIFHFLKGGGVTLIPEKYYPALVLVTVGGSFFIVGNNITIDRIAGACLVLPVWMVLKRVDRTPLLIFCTMLVIVGISYTPFELRQVPREFEWVPFSGALSGHMFINVLAMTKKALLYGSLIYLLVETRIRLSTATIIVSIFLFFNEYLQVFFTSTSPEITDSLLALMIGLAMHFWEGSRRKSGLVGVAAGRSGAAAHSGHSASLDSGRGGQSMVTAPHSFQPKFIPAMDGLRAVAALAVFFVHFNQKVKLRAEAGPFDLDRLLANGNTGVALFFTLSGLLLSMPFWRANLGRGDFPNLRSYAWHRAARIIPAYYFCLFSILFAISVFGSGSDWANILSHMVFAFNFSDRTILSFNQPFWTLAVEVQFYVLLPLLFLALRKTRDTVTFGLILGLVPLLYLVNVWVIESLQGIDVWPIDQTLIWPISLYLRGTDSLVLTYSTLAHLPHFLLGVLGARVFLLLSDGRRATASLSSVCESIFWLCSLAVILILSTALDDLLQLTFGRYNFPFVPLLLVAMVVSLPFTRIARGLFDLAGVRWLGCISYGIYIYHYPVQKVVSHLMSMADIKAVEYPLVFGIVSLAITLFLSHFSYTLLEAPVMRRVRQYLNKREVDSKGNGAFSADTMEQYSLGRKRNRETLGMETKDTRGENHIPEHLVQEPPHAGRELVLNLHRSQARFLQHLAATTGLEPGEICERLIDLAIQSGTEWENDLIYSPAVKNGLGSFHRKSGDRKWRTLSVYLDNEHIGRLRAIAVDFDASSSRAIRHLLAECMERLALASRHRSSAHSRPIHRFLRQSNSASAMVTIALFAVLLFGAYFVLRDSRLIEVGPHWAGNEANLILDHHTHTRYSDGRLAPGELVELAFQGGCDALVISDHSDKGGTVSDEQMSELQVLRGKYPDLLLFSGIELNMPSYGDREHAGLIADPSVEADTLQQLRDLAERNRRRAQKGGASSRYDAELLQKIADYQSLRNGMLLVYNHPSRKDQHIEENIWDITRWNARGPVFAAIEGAPGHQNAGVVGKYKEPFLTEDGWDPAVADIGGAWDQLLSDGHQLWAALASSDYHNDKMDKPPCQFARTHLIAPEWSHRGVLMALRAGTFWADHGRILDQLWFSVDVDGMEQSAYPGYVVHVGDRDSEAVASLTIERGPGSEGQPLTVEIIGNCTSGDTEVVMQQELAPEDSTVTTLLPLAATGLDEASCFLRARVRLARDLSRDYLAYTNPVRLILN